MDLVVTFLGFFMFENMVLIVMFFVNFQNVKVSFISTFANLMITY